MLRVTLFAACFAAAVMAMSFVVGISAIVTPAAGPVESEMLHWQKDRPVNESLSGYPKDMGWVVDGAAASEGQLLIFLKRYSTEDERREQWSGVWTNTSFLLLFGVLMVMVIELAVRALRMSFLRCEVSRDSTVTSTGSSSPQSAAP